MANARDAVRGSGREDFAEGAESRPESKGVIEISAFLASSRDGNADSRRPEEVVITVSDDGGGLPEDVIGHVFEPFFTTKRAGEGTGLGLAIGYSIVSGMGGSISASNGQAGAVFEIRLPVVIADPDVDSYRADSQMVGE